MHRFDNTLIGHTFIVILVILYNLIMLLFFLYVDLTDCFSVLIEFNFEIRLKLRRRNVYKSVLLPMSDFVNRQFKGDLTEANPYILKRIL